MASALLDASALLALLYEETGSDQVRSAVVAGAAMSAVNAAEVAARLHSDNWTGEEVAAVFDTLNIEVLPLDTKTALLSGQYRPGTQALGLSLGVRVCLAVAYLYKLPALTADKAWLRLNVEGVVVESIR
ncbi:MAG: PIN domain-containing protein [Pseudomonadaceae bacterium]|nr:PIN domain-containing protein [Pseudomonadaceae bacterium]